MPDILIRMEMPKSCDECPCFSQYDSCDVTGSWKFADEFDKSTARLPDCPLIELPPHGDLIDRDALIKDGWLNLHKEVMRMGGYAIHELPLKNPSIPVVVPAERSGE